MSKYIKVYRVVENTNSNDFNNEMPYTIITYELDEKNNKMRVSGYAQWVDAKDFYYYRGLAEQDLVRLCSNQLQQENEQLKKELAEKDEKIAEYEQQSNYAYNIGRLQKLLKEKDKKIAELEEELTEKDEDHELLIDDFQKERKSLCKQIKQEFDARKRAVEKIKTIRHEICEKIREKAFATEAFCDDKSEIVTYTIYVDDLNQIERGDE